MFANQTTLPQAPIVPIQDFWPPPRVLCAGVGRGSNVALIQHIKRRLNGDVAQVTIC